MPNFIPGLELNRRFYAEVVRPLLTSSFSHIPYTAALLGPGSETLGFDTEMSMDHDWGLRLFLFLREENASEGPAIENFLSYHLPETFLDFPVSFPAPPQDPRIRVMKRPVKGPIDHRIIAITLRNFVRIQLGYDLTTPLEAADWLTFPAYALGEFTAGAIYADTLGELAAFRSRLAWYPRDIWLYLLASGWQRIGQEEHLMPRAGSVGDELGSALIASRLVRDIMHLCFLLEKRYAPYPKWFGTAFQRLAAAQELSPLLLNVQRAATWQEREAALVPAYEALARLYNAQGLSEKLPEVASLFYDRPFRVIHGEQFAQALVQRITDPVVQRLAQRRLIGSVNQWSDNTDIEGLERSRLRALYVD